MDLELRGCKVCEAPKKHLTCPQCFHNTVTFDKTWRKLAAARRLRAELEEHVTAALQSRETYQQQQRELRNLQERISEAKLQAKHLQEQTETTRAEIRQTQAANATYQAEKRAALQAVENHRRHEDEMMPAEVQQRLLHLHIIRDNVSAELRRHVRVLLDILPLRLGTGARPSSGRSGLRGNAPPPRPDRAASPTVTILGCQLPSSLVISSGTNQQKLSTALGHVTLLTDILASLLGAPLVNCLRFKGSTSELCLQCSFWEERPNPHGPVYRLYYAATLPSPVCSPGSPAAGGALGALRQHWLWENTFKSAPAAGPSLAATARRQKEDLAAAIHQLMRSIAALLSDQLLHFSTRLPQEWSPFAALAGLCMQLAAKPRSADGRRSLTASLAAPGLLRGGESNVFLDTFFLDGEQDDEEVDGWDLVQRPAGLSVSQRGRPDPLRMPPTPSDAEETIIHWERAMITDSSSGRSAQAQPYSLGRHIAPLGQGALAAADRLWQGLTRSGS